MKVEFGLALLCCFIGGMVVAGCDCDLGVKDCFCIHDYGKITNVLNTYRLALQKSKCICLTKVFACLGGANHSPTIKDKILCLRFHVRVLQFCGKHVLAFVLISTTGKVRDFSRMRFICLSS